MEQINEFNGEKFTPEALEEYQLAMDQIHQGELMQDVHQTVIEISDVFGKQSNASEQAKRVEEAVKKNWEQEYQKLFAEMQKMQKTIQEQQKTLEEKLDAMERNSLHGRMAHLKDSVQNWFTEVKDSATNWIENQKTIMENARTAKTTEKEFYALQSERISLEETRNQKTLSMEYLQERAKEFEKEIDRLKEQVRDEKEKAAERKTAIEAVKNLFRKKEQKKDLLSIDSYDMKNRTIQYLEKQIQINESKRQDAVKDIADLVNEMKNLDIKITLFNKEHPDLFTGQELDKEDVLKQKVREAREHSPVQKNFENKNQEKAQEIDMDMTR